MSCYYSQLRYCHEIEVPLRANAKFHIHQNAMLLNKPSVIVAYFPVFVFFFGLSTFASVSDALSASIASPSSSPPASLPEPDDFASESYSSATSESESARKSYDVVR